MNKEHKFEINVGSTLLAGSTIFAILEARNYLGNRLFGDKEEVRKILQTTPNGLLVEQQTAIAEYMGLYLSPRSLKDIIDMSNAKPDPQAILVFSGFAFHNRYAVLETFVPYTVGWGKEVPNESVLTTQSITTDGLIEQMRLVAGGYTNTLLGQTGQYRPNDKFYFFQDNIPVYLPNWAVTWGKAELKAIKELGEPKKLSSQSVFEKEVARNLDQYGICGIAVDFANHHDTHGDNFVFSFLDKNGKPWKVQICQIKTSGAVDIPPGLDLEVLPEDIGLQFDKQFEGAGSIEQQALEIHWRANPNQYITLFKKGSEREPGGRSAIVGYKQSQLEGLFGRQEFSVSPGVAATVLSGVAGVVIIARAISNGLEETRRRIRAEKPVGAVVKRTRRTRETRTETTPARLPEIKKRLIPFTFDFGSRPVELSNPDEMTDPLREILISQSIEKRLAKTSSGEVAGFIYQALTAGGNFNEIRQFLNERRARFAEIQVGGDSATVSYKIGNQDLYLLIDANLEENYVQVEFWNEEPKITSIAKRREESARETIAQAVGNQERQHTVGDISRYLSDGIASLVGNTKLDATEFEELRNECVRVAGIYKNDSRVKKEIIRRLAGQIAANQISIYTESEKLKRIYQEEYARTVAARIFEYAIKQTAANAEEFEAFTHEADRLINLGGLTPIPQTATKFWIRRTRFRLHVVQVKKGPSRSIAVVFTHHGHDDE